jgi:mRNA interferase RelE/StbE
MTAWIVVYIKEAENDLKELDHSQQLHVLRAIQKMSANPLPDSEGGYGKPLGNRATTHLAGYLKIKLVKLGIRVVYCLVREKNEMKIIIISIREDEKVYKMAQERINREK